ncbi:PspC domain-containing protein [Actinotalea sp. K2]|uniref:PspC domain-containing protein n=1 Tax=Actinotalea sp. K2 TaxID=2939438 RepID=UPI002017E485|nr:PspC domain-containing protein [Actinotalea sp. K2]MCL3859916.1 LiaF-related protein [Actinotalea sp. K2]
MDTTPPPPAHDPAAGPQPVPPHQQPPAPSGMDSFFDGIRRAGLVRSDERWVGGVAGGIALRLGVDVVVVRGLLAVTVLLGGLGLVVYGLGWALLPEQRDGRIHLQQLFRGDFDIAVLGAFAVFATGLSLPDRWNLGMWWGGSGNGWTALLWISAIALIVVLVVGASNRTPSSGRPPGPTTTLPRTPPPGAYPGTGAPTYASAAPHRPEGPTTTMPPTAPYPTQGAPTPPVHPGPPPAYTSAQPPHQPPYGPTGPVTQLPKPSAGGPGSGVVGVIAALSLLTLAGLLYAERIGEFDGPVLLTAGAVAVILAGLGIIISGLRGRTSGPLGGLSVLAILVLLPVAAVTNNNWSNWSWNDYSTTFGDLTHTPREVDEAERGYSLGAGEARIDLTELPLDGTTIEVPISVGAGEVTVIVPRDGAFTAEVEIFAGELRWLDGQVSSGVGGGTARTLESPAVRDGEISDIDLVISVGAGTVRIEEGR